METWIRMLPVRQIRNALESARRKDGGRAYEAKTGKNKKRKGGRGPPRRAAPSRGRVEEKDERGDGRERRGRSGGAHAGVVRASVGRRARGGRLGGRGGAEASARDERRAAEGAGKFRITAALAVGGRGRGRGRGRGPKNQVRNASMKSATTTLTRRN